MRWAKDITLINVTSTQKPNGSWSKTEVRTSTFCNPMTIGTTAYMAAREAGLHADAEVQLRACEYAGQERVEMDGVEYTVERVLNTGEYTRLTLAKRSDNV